MCPRELKAPGEDCVARIMLHPGMPPFIEREFPTAQEARSYERAWWAAQDERRRRRREESLRKAERTRREFHARVVARHRKVEERLQRSGLDVTCVDGFLYRRSEFRSLRRPVQLPRAARGVTRSRRSVRTGPRRARAPASKADDPGPRPDLAQLGAASKRLWAHVRRREARQRLAA